MEDEQLSSYIFASKCQPTSCSICSKLIFDDDIKIAACLGVCERKFHLGCWPDLELVKSHTDQCKPLKVLCSKCEGSRLDPTSVLPLEITQYMFSAFLNVRDLKACSLVSHVWHSIANSSIVWCQKEKENAVYRYPPHAAQESKKTACGRQKAKSLGWEYLALKTQNIKVDLTYLHRFDTDGISLGVMVIVNEMPREWVLQIFCMKDNSCIQKIPLRYHSPVFKMTTNTVLIIEGSIFSLYKKKKVFELVKTWAYNKDLQNYASKNEDHSELMSTWSLEGVSLNPYFMYFKYLENCEVHVWSVDSVKIVKKVNFPESSFVHYPSNSCGNFCLSFVNLATPTKAVVLNGTKELCWSFSNNVISFNSNKRNLGFMLLNLCVVIFDYNQKILHRYICDFGGDAGIDRHFNCHVDGSIMYKSKKDTFYCCKNGKSYKIENFVANDSWSFMESSVILKNAQSIYIYNAFSKTLINKPIGGNYIFVLSYPNVFMKVNYRFNSNDITVFHF